MLTRGDTTDDFILKSISNSEFSFSTIRGKRCLLSFYRFASCPFCNLRIHELVKRHKELDDNLLVIAIFDSSVSNLQKHAVRHNAPFAILADENGAVYKQFCVRRSFVGILKGLFGRLPVLIYSILVKGNVPLHIKGNITTMPADFLIDENGIIHTAYYGKDAGDHLSFDKIKAFAFDKV